VPDFVSDKSQYSADTHWFAHGEQQLMHQFIDHFRHSARAYFSWLWQQEKSRIDFWERLFSITILAAYLYTFMEWLFFATMPSFMSLLGLFNKIEIFLLSGLGFSLFCLLLIAAFIIIDLLSLIAHAPKISSWIGIIIPSIILSALVLLLVDNFTYSLFNFGISTTSGAARAAYTLLFVLILILVYFWMLKVFGLRGNLVPNERRFNRLFYASIGLLVISLGLGLVKLKYTNPAYASPTEQNQPAGELPNIILLGSDGLNAQNLSVYGYDRNTTRQLAELAKTSLVAENAFTNAGNTAGSVISIMTSKLPTQTRVLFPPDILTGNNSYQHLPGILKSLGYKTVEYGVAYYIDAYNYNLQNGFDIVNNRTLSVGKLGNLGRKLGYDEEVYFLSRITWRISDRLLHIFFVQTMQNPFNIVTEPVPDIIDSAKIDEMLDTLDHTDGPIFIHTHLLDTHGGYYEPPDQYYSIGKSQTKPWMVDFYDDTLRAFDSYVGKVVYHLKRSGQFDNTILIIYTDHNQHFQVNERIPLILHFPGGEYGGKITRGVQNMDIAPTVLDYLGLHQPTWMNGESMLDKSLMDNRLIFSTGTNETKPNENDINFIDPALDQPPFYQFSYLNVIDCQMWYRFDLTTFEWTSGEVIGYVKPCSPKDLHSPDEIRQAMYQRLATDGFDITSLP
jgi:hypothetical protein